MLQPAPHHTVATQFARLLLLSHHHHSHYPSSLPSPCRKKVSKAIDEMQAKMAETRGQLIEMQKGISQRA